MSNTHKPTQVRNDAKLANTQPQPPPTQPQTQSSPHPLPTIPTNPTTQTTSPSNTSVMAWGSLTGHPWDHKRSLTPLTPVRSGPPHPPPTPTHHNPPNHTHPNNAPNLPNNPAPKTPTQTKPVNPTTQFQTPSLGQKLLTGSGVKRKRDEGKRDIINGCRDSSKKMKLLGTMCSGECRSETNTIIN